MFAAARYSSGMSRVAFDTLRVSEILKGAGVADEVAAAIVASIGVALGDGVATKADIEALQTATKSDIEALKTATKADIEALKAATKSDIDALKADIDDLKASTKSDIETAIGTVKSELRAEIAALEARIYRHMWFMAAGIVVVTVTLIKVIP